MRIEIMRHGSLFSGIGGFDLAASWMGWENVFQCEKNPFCKKVLQYYWPNAECYGDVRALDARGYRGRIDILTGGFPCQPFSTAGRRKGTGDDRYLWPEMCRIIGEIRPRWIIGENVVGFLNWGRGLVFEKVLADLEDQGYEAWPYILPAAGVGAPHRRDRVWIVAYAAGLPGSEAIERRKEHNPEGEIDRFTSVANGEGEPAAVSDRLFHRQDAWKYFPTQPPVSGGNDGLSSGLDGIAVSKWCEESVKGAGNAIVPQVAFEIFKAIEKLEARRNEA